MTHRELEEIEARYRDPYNCTHPNATADILRLIAEVRILKAQLTPLPSEPKEQDNWPNERFFEAK